MSAPEGARRFKGVGTMDEILQRLRALEVLVDDIRSDIADMKREWERIRARTHVLENDNSATKAAQAALEATRALQRQAWSKWDRIGLFLFAGIGAAAALTALLTR